MQIKHSINGDEYYTPENAVNMILPYIQRGGGIKRFGVRLTKRKAILLRFFEVKAIPLYTGI